MKNRDWTLRSLLLLYSLLILELSSAQQILRVGAGEYATSYVTNTGRLYANYFNGSFYAAVDVGLSNIVDADGAQYTTIARNSVGQVYVISQRTPTLVATDINNNPFTGTSKVYGFFKTYLALKDGNVWYWGDDIVGQNGGVAVPRPKMLTQPGGKTIIKLVVSSGTTFNSNTLVLGLASDGTVWKWNNATTNPQQISFPGVARDIAAVGSLAYVIETNNDLLGWGIYGSYVGAPNFSNSPVSIKAAWQSAGVVFPTKELIGNYNTLHLIDQNDNLFGSGSNVMGEVGNGIAFSPYRTQPNPYAWDWNNGKLIQSPVQIPGKFKNIQTSNTIAFYHYVQDMGGNWYSWGRNKARVLGNGVTLSGLPGGEDIYPNFRDVPAPTLVTPLTQTWTVLSFDPNAPQDPLANAGVNQYISSNSTTLYGSGTFQQEGTIVSYQWSKVSGGNCTISSPSSMNTAVTGLSNGTYLFRLRVTNNRGISASSNVTVVVSSAPSPPSPPNQAPMANAGIDISVTLPVTAATLNGSGNDADGTIANYSWQKLSGPAGGSLSAPSAAQTNITSLTAGVYVYRLTVTDNGGLTATDDVQVTVNNATPPPPPPNQAPVANAGSDNTIILPVATATLSGSGNDADGTIANYSWQKLSGPAGGSLSAPSAAQTNIIGLTAGVYIYRLTVTDNGGLTAADDVQITVNNAPPPPPPSPNLAPSANAGADAVITLPVNTATLSGSGSDPDGTIVGYSWQKLSGPAGDAVSAPNAGQTNITGLASGVYVYRLTVTDNGGLTATDDVQITVNSAPPPPPPSPNLAPSANAGADVVITLPVNTVTLSGSGSDLDGTIAGYSWQKLSGPTGDGISVPTAAQTNITGLTAGVYVYRLTVTDNGGLTATDDVQVIVNNTLPPPIPAANLAPVSNAGPDVTIELPQNTATLNGSASDPDGAIASVNWLMKSGPSIATISNPGISNPVIGNLVKGQYEFELTVTDNLGAKSSDVVVVDVIKIGNSEPIVRLPDTIFVTFPAQNAELNATNSLDPDGRIIEYRWNVISGPDEYRILDPSSSLTIINNLKVGNYLVELSVKDDDNAVKKGRLVVSVRAAAAVSIVPVISIYPNPASGSYINLKLTSKYIGRTSIKIYDISGRPASSYVMMKSDVTINYTVDIKLLPKGAYTLIVQNAEGLNIFRKFIKL